jgi:hypothetical protein
MIASGATKAPPTSSATFWARAVLGREAGEAAGDAAGALDGDVETGEAGLAEAAAGGGADSEEDSVAGVRARIAADRAFGHRQAGDVAGLLRHLDEVGHADSDVFGGDVGAAQPLDGPAIGGEHLGGLGPGRVGEDHRLAAAEREAGHRILEAHAAREAERVADRVAALGIMPEAHAARARAEVGRVDADDGLQAGFAIGDEMDDLVIVEIGIIPGGMHDGPAS